MLDQSGFEQGPRFCMSASGFLAEQIEVYLHPRGPEENALDRKDFHRFGRWRDRQTRPCFEPYWLPNESFESFTQREAGLNQPPAEVTQDAVIDFFITDRVPLSSEAQAQLESLTPLFSDAEVDALLAYAIAVEDEDWQSFALHFESTGQIEAGSINHIESPLIPLHEAADPEIAAFFEEIRQNANAVYGVPNFSSGPNTDPNVVEVYRGREVIYSEPEVREATKLDSPAWTITIKGDTRAAKNPTGFWSSNRSTYLLNTSSETNQQLTASLLNKPQLLKYWLGARIIQRQRQKMSKLKRLFRGVWNRKNYDHGGDLRPGFEPALHTDKPPSPQPQTAPNHSKRIPSF